MEKETVTKITYFTKGFVIGVVLGMLFLSLFGQEANVTKSPYLNITTAEEIKDVSTIGCKVKIIPRNDYRTLVGFFNRGCAKTWREIIKNGGRVVKLELITYTDDGMNWKRGDLWEARIYYREGENNDKNTYRFE